MHRAPNRLFSTVVGVLLSSRLSTIANTDAYRLVPGSLSFLSLLPRIKIDQTFRQTQRQKYGNYDGRTASNGVRHPQDIYGGGLW